MHLEAAAAEARFQLARERRRSMASAGTADADRQIALTLASIERDQEFEQLTDIADKAARLRMGHHVALHAHVGAVERAECRHKKRIRAKARVAHQIEADRAPVLV